MSAKEMFEKLGYEYDDRIKDIRYIRAVCIPDKINTKWVNCKYITFKGKIVIINEDVHTPTFEQKVISKDEFTLNIEELQAINKQVEELGWLGSDDNEN